MNIGTKLNNGAIVLDSKPSGDSNYIVLALWSTHSHPYVTWLVEANGSAGWGYYFNTLADALASFNAR